ncbi:MAG: methionine adenosyltransferase [Candidatus Nanoarchaeia archaeon]|nr:methionine adenosyltransferase [Candidatus Nanoarchaeia archaeon]
MGDDYVLSSESVGPGHPDKMCDVISDSILDACLKEDPNSRVACETLVKTLNAKETKKGKGGVVLAGEITTLAKPDYERIAREAIRKIGYSDASWGIDPDKCNVHVWLSTQSPDIAQGVDTAEQKEQGAGDQGIMWGFATRETKQLMPLSAYLAHRLVERLDECRRESYDSYGKKGKNGESVQPHSYFRPDTKSQVAVRYEDGKIAGLDNVVVALSHSPEVDMETLRADVLKDVIKPVCGKYLTPDTKFFINGTGRFEFCGPYADAGLTGRKIIVDTYAGIGRHGGGAFSGKDPSKVDRSAAYAARYIAKNIVAAGFSDECEVQLGYCIGIAEPTSLLVRAKGMTKAQNKKLAKAVRAVFSPKPADIIAHFGLKNPNGWCYAETAAFGHFGREQFPWEKTDLAEKLKKAY